MKSLAFRLTLTVGSVVLAATVAVSLSGYLSGRSSIERQIRERIAATATTTASEADAYLAARVDELRQMSTSALQVASLSPVDRVKVLFDYANAFGSNRYTEIAIIARGANAMAEAAIARATLTGTTIEGLVAEIAEHAANARAIGATAAEQAEKSAEIELTTEEMRRMAQSTAAASSAVGELSYRVRDAVALASRIAAQVAGAAREQGAHRRSSSAAPARSKPRRGASRKRRRAPRSRPKTCARRSNGSSIRSGATRSGK